ncbi:hypothetical protein BDZ97DRAFT_1929366 [Flammula alnicola]|nr:hypothetical protein BDZ97DRAFT_1929366 [Flammula alnicola]
MLLNVFSESLLVLVSSLDPDHAISKVARRKASFTFVLQLQRWDFFAGNYGKTTILSQALGLRPASPSLQEPVSTLPVLHNRRPRHRGFIIIAHVQFHYYQPYMSQLFGNPSFLRTRYSFLQLATPYSRTLAPLQLQIREKDVY